jgi:hypothetical protein
LPYSPQINYFNSLIGGGCGELGFIVELGMCPGSVFGHCDSPVPWGGSLLLSCVHLT